MKTARPNRSPQPDADPPALLPDRAVLDAAADQLRAGQLIGVPTETVYGLAANAASTAGVEALRRARSNAAGGLAQTEPQAPHTWHASSLAAVLGLIDTATYPLPPLHRRMIKRLMPGPVTCIVELPLAVVEAVRAALGNLPASVIDSPVAGDRGQDEGAVRAVLIRIPESGAAGELARLLESSPEPGCMIADGLAGVAGALATNAGDFAAAAAARGVAIATVIDGGPSRIGTPSSRVRLSKNPHGLPTYVIESESAMLASQVHEAATYRLLFVCTGNTCRSPMAEAVAADLLIDPRNAPELAGTTKVAMSAGVAASDGEPTSREALVALESLGVRARPHTAQFVTAEMIRQADAVFAMTRAHLAALTRLVPEAKDKAVLLDPDGRDIADPIGGTQSVYNATAAHLQRLIARRVKVLTA